MYSIWPRLTPVDVYTDSSNNVNASQRIHWKEPSEGLERCKPGTWHSPAVQCTYMYVARVQHENPALGSQKASRPSISHGWTGTQRRAPGLDQNKIHSKTQRPQYNLRQNGPDIETMNTPYCWWTKHIWMYHSSVRYGQFAFQRH